MKEFKTKTGNRSLGSSLASRSVFSPKNSIDEAYNIIEKALSTNQINIGPEYAKDEINVMVRDGWGAGHSNSVSLHPIDSAFDSVKKLMNESNHICPGKDEINDFAKDLTVNTRSEHSISDIFRLIDNAYSHLSNSYAKDPVNELVRNGFSSQIYSGESKHSLQEFNCLIESSFGIKKFTSSDFPDPINAEIQNIFGTGVNNESKAPDNIKETPIQVIKSVNSSTENISKTKNSLSASTVKKDNVSIFDLENELLNDIVKKISVKDLMNKKFMEAIRTANKLFK